LILLIILYLPLAREGQTEPSSKKPTDEVSIELRKTEDGIGGVVLSAYLEGSVEKVYDIVSNVPNIHELFPSFQSVEFIRSVETHDPHIVKNLWTYNIKSPFGTKVLEILTTGRAKEHIVEWKRVAGDLRIFQGKWILHPAKDYPGYMHLEYRSYVDGGFFTPQFLVDILNKRDAADMILIMREKLCK